VWLAHNDYYDGDNFNNFIAKVDTLQGTALGEHASVDAQIIAVIDKMLTDVTALQATGTTGWSTYDTGLSDLIAALEPDIRMQANSNGAGGDGGNITVSDDSDSDIDYTIDYTTVLANLENPSETMRTYN